MSHLKPIALVSALSLASPALADPGFVYAFLGPSGSGKSTVIRVLTSDLSPRRMTINDGEDGAVHAHFDDRNIFVVNEKHKEVMDMAAISDAMKKSGLMPAKGASEVRRQLSAQEEMLHKQLEAALAAMPESQRAIARKALEKQFGLTSGPEKAMTAGAEGLVDTGRTETMNDIETRIFEYSRDGRLMSRIWVADPTAITGGAELLAALKQLQELFDEILGDMMAGGKDGPIGGEFLSGVTRIDGVPVAVATFENGLEEVSVLESVTERDLDPADFEPPKGYRLRTMIGPN